MTTLAAELLGPDFKIIDADTHFTEPPDLWVSRAPAKYKDRVPQVRRGDDGRPRWFVDGDNDFGRAGAASVVDRDGNKLRFWDADITAGITADEAHAGSYDAHARVELMDEQGVWAHIMYPNVAGFGAGKLLRLDDKDLSIQIVKTYNDAVAELQETSNGRLLPQALVPFWDIDATVAEIDRARNVLGLRGITMSGEPFNGGLPDLGSPHWDPMYEICTDLSMPINIHIGSGSPGNGHPLDPYRAKVWASQDEHRAYVLMCTQMELANSNFLTNLVTSDLLLRWPDTKWVSVESGIGWIPYVLERTDYQLQEALPAGSENQRPSARELFRKNVFACFWFEESAPQHSLHDVGVDNVMFETDFPHPTCLYPNPVEFALGNLRHHDTDVIKKVMGLNAAKLYGIEV